MERLEQLLGNSRGHSGRRTGNATDRTPAVTRIDPWRAHTVDDFRALTLAYGTSEIVQVTSPHDGPATRGNLCIKGRFGYRHVQNRV
ncbi:hypothetical protein [Streptomyces sp. ALB3]|uniref:hypothetical protein n=1 Tax=Streptomyces sp. ALB3 TaxID=3374278 RepID=UPI0037BD3E18